MVRIQDFIGDTAILAVERLMLTYGRIRAGIIAVYMTATAPTADKHQETSKMFESKKCFGDKLCAVKPP